jgi:hypothetical protein
MWITMEIETQHNPFPRDTDSDIESGLKACNYTEPSQSNHHIYFDEAGGDAAESGTINEDGGMPMSAINTTCSTDLIAP